MTKPFFTLICSLAFALGSTCVSGAVAKVPATTIEHEKALTPELPQLSNGAIIKQFELSHVDMLAPAGIILVRRYYDDRTFYHNGYKAKLSTAIKEIIAPPKHCNLYRTSRDGFCWG